MLIKPWWCVYRDETLGDGADAGGGAEAVADLDKPAADGGAAADPGAAGGEKKDTPADMLAAIDKGLGYEPGADKAVDPKVVAEEKAAADAKAATEKAAKELEEKAAAGDPAAVKAKAEADAKAKAKAEAAKPKDLKSLEITAAEKKNWKPETQQRFNDILATVKTERAAREAAEAQVKPLQESRDAILGVLRETHTTDDDLAQLLEYNRLTKSGKPEDLENALKVVSAQRLSLLKALGRPGDDYDPLKEQANQDLAMDVEDQKITLERAHEIAAARRREAIKTGQERKGEQAQNQQREQKALEDKALADLGAWNAQMAKTDIDFKAKEDILLPRIAEVVKNYEPHEWLKTIQMLYGTIMVPKSPAALPGGGSQPLRPSGAKPGGPAPTSMEEAINQGLGYGSK